MARPSTPRPVWPPAGARGAARRICRLCNAPLPPDAEPGTEWCDRPACQTRRRFEEDGRHVAAFREKDREIREKGEARTAAMLRTAAERIGAGTPDAVPHAVVPFLDVPLRPLTDERREAFLAHLDACIEAAFALPPGERPPRSDLEPPDDPDYSRRRAEVADEGRALDASCAACRGMCCMQGGQTHAFLTAGTIDFVRHQHPGIVPEEVRALYAERLPAESAERSCVFHGPLGCTLPRDVRADICNYWQCRARMALRERLQETGADRAIAIALARDHLQHPEAGAPVARVVSVTPEAFTQHDDLSADALPDRG